VVDGEGKEKRQHRRGAPKGARSWLLRGERIVPCEAATEEKDGLKKETKNGEVHEHGQAESSGPPHQPKKRREIAPVSRKGHGGKRT